MTNYARIARNDDETFSDEAEFVAKRRDELVSEWMTDKAKVTEAIADALSDDGEDFFAKEMAGLFITVTSESRPIVDESAAWLLRNAIKRQITHRLERDAETAAQAEWDSRLTGPEGDL